MTISGAERMDLTFDRNVNGQLARITDNATVRDASFGYHNSGRLQCGDAPHGRSQLCRAIRPAVTSTTTNRVSQVHDADGTLLLQPTYRDGGDLYQDAISGRVT